MEPWTPSAATSLSPRRRCSIRTSGARWCSSPSTTRTARRGSSPTHPPPAREPARGPTPASAGGGAGGAPQLGRVVDDGEPVWVGGPVQPEAVLVLGEFLDPDD